MSRENRFTIDTATGLIAPATQCPSPNCDERPADETAELIVIHGISLPPDEYGGGYIESFFCNALDCARHPYFAEIAGLRVSSHLLVCRDGTVVQFVALHRRAWHAGESCYAGRSACNDFSLGIELEGSDHIAYEDAQYRALNGLLSALRAAYPSLARAAVVGHSEIAPGRKTDPGPAFDWSRVNQASPHSSLISPANR